MVDDQLSRCVIAFVGLTGRPDARSPQTRVIDAVGDVGLDVLPRVRAIVDEVYSADPPLWQAPSVAELGRRADRYLQLHHPELSDEARQAVANDFAYNWR